MFGIVWIYWDMHGYAMFGGDVTSIFFPWQPAGNDFEVDTPVPQGVIFVWFRGAGHGEGC